MTEQPQPTRKPLTARQEAFVLNLFQGKTHRLAWEQAGYSMNMSPAIIDIKASQLAAQAKVKIRLAELQESATSPLIMSVKERQERLSSIARAKLSDHVKDGTITVEGPHPQAVESYQVMETDKGRSHRIKLRDPIQAIAELNKMDHVYEVGTQEFNIQIISNIPRPQLPQAIGDRVCLEEGEAQRVGKDSHETVENSNSKVPVVISPEGNSGDKAEGLMSTGEGGAGVEGCR